MTFSAISALSPLDGRYAAKLASLRPLMSEQGFMHRRVQVEITWLLALSDSGMAELKPFSAEARPFLVNLIHHHSYRTNQNIHPSILRNHLILILNRQG